MTHQITSPDGTAVSRFAFGTMQFGGKADDAASAEMFAACLDAGITHFDTAFVYTDGRSEEILGRLAAPHRDQLVIATKVGGQVDASPTTIRAQFDESRRRLGMEMVDILYLHRFDPDTPLEATFDTFAEWFEAGQFRYLGLSNFAAWQVMKVNGLLAERGMRVDVIQPMYNLVKRQAEVELLPMAADQDILVASYSPLGGGLLTGKYGAKGNPGGDAGRLLTDKMYSSRYAPEWMHKAATDLAALAAEIGTHPATLAAAWVAAHPTRVSPILSASRPDQLGPSLDAVRFELNTELYTRLSALTPTPPPATDRLEEA
ncbi:aldo/keto reductase [Shimia biformata]|uniref:aldo/keto reductase n=1 Tax=Shimia biformata TaxID=1294299 RepID=UPI00194E0D68|nr:aldo/keto reductase [Shimia biformata]